MRAETVEMTCHKVPLPADDNTQLCVSLALHDPNSLSRLAERLENITDWMCTKYSDETRTKPKLQAVGADSKNSGKAD